MFGLRRFKPITAWAMLLGVLFVSHALFIDVNNLSADEGSKTVNTAAQGTSSEGEDDQLWGQVLHSLEGKLTPNELDILNTSSSLVRVSQDTFRIQTLNGQAQDLAELLNGEIEALLSQIIGLAVNAEVSIQDGPGKESPANESPGDVPSNTHDSESQNPSSCEGTFLNPMGEGLQQSLKSQIFNGDRNGDGIWGNPLKDANGEYLDQVKEPKGPHKPANESLRDDWRSGKIGADIGVALQSASARTADENLEVALDLAVKALGAAVAYEKAVQEAVDLPADASEEQVNEAIEKAEKAKKAAEAARKAADEARKKVMDPDMTGGGSPCEDQEWFSETLPHLVGTIWDPYLRRNAIEDRDPTKPSPETSNPNPFEDLPTEAVPENPTSNLAEHLGGDCDNLDGCGTPEISDARAQQILELLDPANICGPAANTGPDGDCGIEDDFEVPEPAPPAPSCAFCQMGQVTTTEEVLVALSAYAGGIYNYTNGITSNVGSQGELMRPE